MKTLQLLLKMRLPHLQRLNPTAPNRFPLRRTYETDFTMPAGTDAPFRDSVNARDLTERSLEATPAAILNLVTNKSLKLIGERVRHGATTCLG
ncbi:hypothetical protein AA0229_1889 [Gluconobacter cerinus NRIC 0229]|nr:hypothetical protein AA0229_1889 [Gluconobacter cerinus NRIC 0229]